MIINDVTLGMWAQKMFDFSVRVHDLNAVAVERA